jgi:hypothetical protein
VSLRKLFEQIESNRTAAVVNVASGKSSFFRNILSLPAVTELGELCKEPANAADVLRRVIALSAQAVDERYENPFDACLSAYLLILQEERPDLAQVAAAAIRRAANCWWSVDLARGILNRKMIRTSPQESGNVEIANIFHLPSSSTRFDGNETGDMLLIWDFLSSPREAMRGIWTAEVRTAPQFVEVKAPGYVPFYLLDSAQSGTISAEMERE